VSPSSATENVMFCLLYFTEMISVIANKNKMQNSENTYVCYGVFFLKNDVASKNSDVHKHYLFASRTACVRSYEQIML